MKLGGNKQLSNKIDSKRLWFGPLLDGYGRQPMIKHSAESVQKSKLRRFVSLSFKVKLFVTSDFFLVKAVLTMGNA